MTDDYEPFDAEAYQAGKDARREGKPITANPYKPSGHERDTTYEDECHHDWEMGWESE